MSDDTPLPRGLPAVARKKMRSPPLGKPVAVIL